MNSQAEQPQKENEAAFSKYVGLYLSKFQEKDAGSNDFWPFKFLMGLWRGIFSRNRAIL